MTIPCPSTSTYSEFRIDSLLPNKPVLLPPTVTANWAALHSPSHAWSAPSTTSGEAFEPAYTQLTARYGHHSITVVECGSTGCEVGDSELPGTLGELLALWAAGEGRRLYLKDWHLPRMLIEENKDVENELYSVPEEWSDDWLNGYWADEKADDFRFLYLGGGDTFTPLHRDVFASYSISTNLHGSKLWTLFPPTCEPEVLELLQAAGRSVGGDGSVDVRTWSAERRATFAAQGMVEVTQQRWETIFIPSGWYHQVENLSHPTFSLNHNWLNAHDLVKVYDTLERDVAAARASIEDVEELLQTRTDPKEREEGWRWEREFEGCVREMVKQNSGWDWTTFWGMVRHALRRIGRAQGEPAANAAGAQWPLCPTPATAQPPIAYTLEQVMPLVARFQGRSEAEGRWTTGLGEVVSGVEAEVARLSSAD